MTHPHHILSSATIFRVAMLAEVETGAYNGLSQFSEPHRSWIIVSRRSQGGSVLTLGLAGAVGPKDDERMAPKMLRPATTRYAQLFHKADDLVEFMFLRNLPRNDDVEGVFEPSEGYARFEPHADGPRLLAFGRCANRMERRSGVPVLTDIPNPPSATGISWRLSARRIPWAGEVIVE